MIATLELFRRLLPWLGLAAIPLVGLLVAQTIDARHWHKQSDRYEQLYHDEQGAHRQTQLNYHIAAEKARKDDLANKQRVEREQKAASDERTKAYEARLADARARAERLRHELEAATHPSGAGKPSVPGVSNAPGRPDGSASEGGLSLADRLTATEQAIRLDELQKWVKQQLGIDMEGNRPK